MTDKILRDKTFNFSKDLKYDGYQRLQWFIDLLTLMVYKVFDQKLLVVVLKMKIFLLKNYTNQILKTLIKEKYTHF